MPNRTQAPPLKEITRIPLHDYNVLSLDNGIPLYEVNKGTQDILKLELVFQAGRWFETEKLISRTTARLLREGSISFNSKHINEQIDYFGGSLRSSANLDTSHISLYCLRKHFPKILPVLESLLVEPVFPEKELNNFKRIQSQRMKIDLTKNDIIAYREITQAFYGPEHPYGYNGTPDLYEKIDLGHVKEFHKANYHANSCTIFLSGRTDKKVLNLLNSTIGQSLKKAPFQLPDHHLEPLQSNREFIKRPGSVQSAIRIGRRVMSKDHPDFPGFYILNAILGGYFGSRLMNNIREEKGYTYGIYSMIDTMLRDSYFYVSTEVACEVTQATISEIYKEIRMLREKPVSHKEIDKVRNYLTGMLLTSLDGAFNMADVIKTLVLENLDPSYIDKLLIVLKEITPQKLQELAQKYLREEDLFEVVVGLEE